jgi:protein-S-isoprenylcysteine O-methyltransferase Ste14
VALALKNLLFTVLVPGTVAGYLPYRMVRGQPAAASPALLAAATLLFALGLAGYLWCVLGFAVVGRGTPAPIDAPRRLVVVGLHRLVRNPMYLSVLTVIAGWAVLYRSARVAAYLGAVALLFHLVVLVYEEPALARRFGGEYDAYRRSVNRWLPRRRGGREEDR